MELWQHLLMWLFGLLLLGSCVAYGIEWWKARGFWKACRFFGTVFLTGLVLWIAIPDSIDRILGRYETTGGTCYITENTSRGGGITLWMEEEIYHFQQFPDVAYGPGISYDCEVTLTKVNGSEERYVLMREGEILFESK